MELRGERDRMDTDSDRSLSQAEIHDVLRNDRRREVLTVLQDREGDVSIRELAEHIAAIESGEDPPPRNLRQSVYVSLHQTHLPKLDDLGIVDYDTNSKTVHLRERSGAIEPYMGTVEPAVDRVPAWAYLAVGVVGMALAGAATAGAVPGVDPAAVAVVALVVVIAVSAYDLWQERSG